MNLYELRCPKDHLLKLNASDLEAFLDDGDWGCPKCKKSLDLDGEVSLRCHICDMVYPVSEIEEAKDTIDGRCPPCEERGFTECSIHVPDSFYERKAMYEWMRNGKDISSLDRKGRTDYWEGVVHFCKAEEFASIFKDGRIKAGKTGLYNLPAVCLSEATAGGWDELKSRHGDFGYIFRKRDIIVAGGGPVLYMSPDLIKTQVGGFSDQIKPFVNILRIPSVTPGKSKHDFLHEREWRLPRDLMFSKVRPEAVILGEFTKDTEGWEHIFKAVMEIEENDWFR